MNVRITDRHAISFRHIQRLVPEAISVVIMRVGVLNEARFPADDPFLALREICLLRDAPQRAAGGQFLCAALFSAALDQTIRPGFVFQRSDPGFRLLAMLHDNIPDRVSFSAEIMIFIVAVGVDKLKTGHCIS